MTTFLDVETADFAAASRSMYDGVAEPVRAAVLGLSAALGGSGAMAGSDPGGQAWAASYDRAAWAALQAGQDVGNGCYRLASMFRQSALNYEAADAASSARSRCAVVAQLPFDTSFGIGAAPPSAAGGSGDPPAAWRLIGDLVGYVWPNGHQDRLHAAASAWDRAALSLDGRAFEAALSAISFARDRLPEADDMITVCQGMNGHLRELASVYGSLASACRGLAGHIDTVHAAVETEMWELAWQTGAIEGVGFVAGLFTFGLAEVPSQAFEGWRLTAIALRVGELIRTFIAAAKALAQTVTALFERAGQIVARVRAVLAARAVRAGTVIATRYPRTMSLIRQRIALMRLDPDSGHVILLKYVADQRQLERKYRHAKDFGVALGRGRAGFEALRAEVQKFVSDPKVVRINGFNRGERAILSFDPPRRLVVIQHADGTFWTCYRMTHRQLQALQQTGRIGVE